MTAQAKRYCPLCQSSHMGTKPYYIPRFGSRRSWPVCRQCVASHPELRPATIIPLRRKPEGPPSAA